MKIYKLTISEKLENPLGMATNCLPSSSSRSSLGGLFLNPNRERKIEYYLSKEKAEAKKQKVEETISDLVGLISAVDIVITEIEVIE